MATVEATPKPFPFPSSPGPRPSPAPPGPVERVLLPTGARAWLVTRHDDVRHLLRSADFSADFTAPGFPVLRRVPAPDPQRAAGLFIRMDAPEHTRFRRMLT